MSQELDTPEIDWNELVLVSKYQGKVRVWSAWKRAISAFANPELWESTENWTEHFKPQDGKAYGMVGYGLIVMDLDSKQGWSINDYTSPESIHLPQDYQLDQKDETGFLKSLEKLLGRADQWSSVEFKVSPKPGEDEFQEMKLSEMIDPGNSAKENLRKLASVRGEIQIQGQPRMVMSGRYIPKGWKVATTRGRHDLDVLEECLLAIREIGFPLPSKTSIMSMVEDTAPDMEDEEAGVFSEDIVQRFENLLANWAGLPASKTPKP